MSEISKLPATWAWASVSDLLTGIETGKSFKCDERPPHAGEAGVVKVSAVSWGQYKELESKTCLEAERVNPKLFIQPGDFLFSRANTQELVGACVIAQQAKLCVMLSDKILRFLFADNTMKPWLLSFLRSADGRMQIESLASGNQDSMRNISQERIGQIRLPLPPRSEQARIVAKLEELLSDLDAGVAELKAAQKKLAQYRQSLLKAAVEGALTAGWRAARFAPLPPRGGGAGGEGACETDTAAPTAHPLPNPSPVKGEGLEPETGAQLLERILQERRARWEAKQLAKFAEQGKTPPKDWQKKYPEPVQPDTTGLPELPEGWVWASVDQLLADIESGKSFKCEERPPQDHEVGVVKVSAVSWGEYNELESKTCHDDSMIRPELFVNVGDFLFSRANTIELVGACVIAQAVTKRVMLSDKILRLVLVNEELKSWLLSLLRSEFGRQHIEMFASGNQESMRNIGQERLRQIPVPLPCLSEVEQASELLSVNIRAASEQEQAIDLSLKQSTAQRQNILRAAFAGQLVPQDPNDEPASVLLERIRAERVAREAVKKPRGRKVKESV